MLLVLSFAVPVFAGTGTITVSGVAPEVVSIAIMPSGGSGNLSAIDVYTWYDVKVVVSDTDKLTDIKRLELRMFQTSWSETFDKERRYGFKWYCNAPEWQSLGASGWTDPDAEYFAVAGSSKPSDMSATEGTWTFQVRLAKVAHYTTGGSWTIEAYVWDKSDNQAWRSNNFDVNLFIELIVTASITFEATPGDSNKTQNSPPFEIDYRANCIAKIMIQASDPTSTFGDSFSADNLLIDDDESPNTDARCQKLSGSAADWWTGLPVAGTPDPANKDAWWFVSVPAGQPTGTYTFTYTMTIDFDQLAT